MKRLLFYIPLLLLFFNCENYISNNEINSIISINDLNVIFKIKKDNNHTSIITIQIDPVSNDKYIIIDVLNALSISSGEIDIIPAKKYKLSIIMKNISADPIILYSFWIDNLTESRFFAYVGENINPPKSETQSINNDWIKYEEVFATKVNEKYMMIKIFSNAGIFNIKDISIEEI